MEDGTGTGTYQGEDGLLRKAKIKTATIVYDRPNHKSCLIATNDKIKQNDLVIEPG